MAAIVLSKCLGAGVTGAINLATINFRGAGGSGERLPDYNEDFSEDFLIEEDEEQE